jgi:hypothetical protein
VSHPALASVHQVWVRRLASARVPPVWAWRRPTEADRSIAPASADMRGAVPALIAALTVGRAALAQDATAAACAAKLPKDAKTIFDATLPKIIPGANLRDLVTATTRSLAVAGNISRSTARDSAIAAGQCLQQAG